MAPLLLLLLSIGPRVYFRKSCRACKSSVSRLSEPNCNELSSSGPFRKTSKEQFAWRKLTSAAGDPYWIRATSTGGVEVSQIDPKWRPGELEDGDKYFWRTGSNGKTEVLFPDDYYDVDEIYEYFDDLWRVGFLESGRRFLWRETADPNKPEMKFWTEGTLDDGRPFWYDVDGEVTLTDPFAGALER